MILVGQNRFWTNDEKEAETTILTSIVVDVASDKFLQGVSSEKNLRS